MDPENYPLYESFFSTLLTKMILHFNVLFRKFKLGKEGMKYKCQNGQQIVLFKDIKICNFCSNVSLVHIDQGKLFKWTYISFVGNFSDSQVV